jgi:hypothetical protein
MKTHQIKIEEKFDDSFLLKKIYKFLLGKKMKERRPTVESITKLLNKFNDKIILKKN